MAKRRAPGAVRFVSSSQLRLEDGSTLSAGDVLTGPEARGAVGTMRVLLHTYPRTEDITDDPARIAEATSRLRTDGQLFSCWARIFSDGRQRVLVLELHH